MLERAVRGALMNSLSFHVGFYFLLSAVTALGATLALLAAIHWAIPVAMVVSALLVNLFAFLDLDPASVPGALRRVARPPPGACPRPSTASSSGASVSRIRRQSGKCCTMSAFSITRGQTLAVVGRNGSGKTTIVKLLTRLYDATRGQILINGKDIREFDPGELQQRFAAVFQDCVRYALTARENVGFGDVRYVDD